MAYDHLPRQVPTTTEGGCLSSATTRYYRNGQEITSHEMMVESQLDQIQKSLERIAKALETKS